MLIILDDDWDKEELENTLGGNKELEKSPFIIIISLYSVGDGLGINQINQFLFNKRLILF